jgi:hypothetical protein
MTHHGIAGSPQLLALKRCAEVSYWLARLTPPPAALSPSALVAALAADLPVAPLRAVSDLAAMVSVLLCAVTFHANLAHSLTRSP